MILSFMKSIGLHEEISQRQGRAYSEQDAIALLSEAKGLGVNMIRLAHYPQNEYIVRLAEQWDLCYGRKYQSGRALI